MSTLGMLVAPKVEQSGPSGQDFVYVDISSIDTETKRIADPKRLASDDAPSRARQRLKSGDVVVSMTRPNRNAVALVPPELDGAIGSTGFHVLRPSDSVDSKWLYYAVQDRSFVREMTGLVQGALYPAVRPKDINSYEISPPALPIQREIVAEIEKQFSRLDEAVANLKRVKANLKRYKAAVLKAAAEGRLVSGSDHWTQAELGSVAVAVRNGLSQKPDADRGARIFRISAVRPLELAVDDVRYLSGELADYEAYLLREGDLLFTRYNGNRHFVGVCAMVPKLLLPTVYPDKLIRVRLDPTKVLPGFVEIAAAVGQGRAFLKSKIRTTAGQSGVSGSDVKAMPLSFPGLSAQMKIVEEVERRLSLVRGVELQVNSDLRRAERLRQSVLTSAFG